MADQPVHAHSNALHVVYGEVQMVVATMRRSTRIAQVEQQSINK